MSLCVFCLFNTEDLSALFVSLLSLFIHPSILIGFCWILLRMACDDCGCRKNNRMACDDCGCRKNNRMARDDCGCRKNNRMACDDCGCRKNNRMAFIQMQTLESAIEALSVCIPASHGFHGWLCSVVVKASDSWPKCRKFESWSVHCRVV